MKTFQFTSESGRRFLVQLVDHEDPGFWQAAHQKPGDWLYQHPQILFLDNQTGLPRPIGASYYLGTFLGQDHFTRGRPRPWEVGLCLHGGMPMYNLSASDCAKVKEWLDGMGATVEPEPEKDTLPPY